MITLVHDLRYALRVLRRAPGFTAVALLTLALGIGVNSAMFSIVNAVLLKQLPFPDPGRLVAIYTTAPQSPHGSSSYLNFLDWTRRSRSFEHMSAFREDNFNVTGNGEPERVRVGLVSASFFDLLGLEPVLGRTLMPEDDQRGATPVVVLGEPYWKERFGGDPGVIGRTLVMNTRAYTVIGVAPSDLPFARAVRAYVAIGTTRDALFWERRVAMGLTAFARLKVDTTFDQANAEMSTIARALAQEYPKENEDTGIALVTLREALVGDVRQGLLVLLGAVVFVLLIACANVANLWLARSPVRRREFAIRTAIGAGGGRLVRQVLTEGALLAVAGGGAGLALGASLATAISGWIGGDLPARVGLDARVVAFTAAIALLAGIASAAVPAWQTARADPNAALREGGRGTSGRRRTQRVLVIAEIALALVLTTGAGLMVRTMWHLWQADPGFEPQGALTFALAGTPSTDRSAQAVREGYVALEQRVRAVPGVEASSIIFGSVPLATDSQTPFWVVGQPYATEQTRLPWALFSVVSGGYRPAFGLKLLRGRFIAPADTEKAPYVIVIDEELARAVFLSTDPIGEQIHVDFVDADYRVVGVVGHVRHWGLDTDAGARVRSQMYMSFRQLPDAVMPLVATQSAWVVRSRLPQGVLAGQIKQAIHDVDPGITMFNVRTMEQVIDHSLMEKRLARLLLGSFAALALLLAAVGIYGVMSQVVLQGTRDIGVRIAVGASPRAVLGMVLASGMSMAAAGIAVGAALTLAATRLIEGLLYGVTASDPLTVAGVAAILAGVALVASVVPAWRATRVDPISALRCE